AWLRGLSDGFIAFDADVYAKLAGPVSIRPVTDVRPIGKIATDLKSAIAAYKPYFIGLKSLPAPDRPALPAFTWADDHHAPLKRTTLYEAHKRIGAKRVPFAGWEMPVWYTSVVEEHRTVREAAGLFDVSHMGVLDACGPNAAPFLDLITANDVAALEVGESHYTYLLGIDGIPIDDLLIYRLAEERFLLVVNASNNDKDWAWLNAVNDGQAAIDARRPWVRNTAPCVLRDLRDRQWGAECRVDIALQGPKSMAILQSICDDATDAASLGRMPRTHLMQARLRGFDVIVSRTGYTGESVGYELFVHPDKAPEFWDLLLEAGASLGVKPTGLAARDSTRTEAGLPLYGHELAGPLNLMPNDAGFAPYVKTFKPFFVGREAYLAHEARRTMEVARFRMNDKGVRVPKGAAALETGGDMDYVVDKRGRVIGRVLSCAIDSAGYLTGQALVEKKHAVDGTPIGILPASKDGKPAADLKIGARVPTIEAATVISRFPKRK
ncbi:MAG TPA: glycine cleavage system aminomethyltransferase GcvT, partial [Anaerolineae bacterium]